MKIFYYPKIDSTNNEARRLLSGGASEACIILAGDQTFGRGRRSRRFYTEKRRGLYATFLLRNQEIRGKTETVPLRIALAISGFFSEKYDIRLALKWVNDLYYNDKKVGGILTERTPEWTVIGIGINFSVRSFPEELSGVAGNLPGVFDREATEKELYGLSGEIFQKIREILSDETAKWRDAYTERMIGRNEDVIYGNCREDGEFQEISHGVIRDVSPYGELLIETDGEIKRLTAEEISFRRR